MNWLENADCEAIKSMLRHSSSLYLVSTVEDRRILWANPSFCDWSKYSLIELIRTTWDQISVDDVDLDADRKLAETLDEYNLTYTIQKRYIPKNDKPQLGNLHVTRYPASGPIQFCFCRWEPLVNGTAQAFELALQNSKKVADQMNELTNQVAALTQTSEEQRFTLSLVRMIQKYPKTALATVLLVLSLGGFETVLSTLQKLGYISQPPVVVRESK